MMPLWLLQPVEDRPALDDPWNPWFDKCFGMVVRASTEDEARSLAHEKAANENRGMFLGQRNANTNTPWLDAKYSTCSVLVSDGCAEVVIRDMRWS